MTQSPQGHLPTGEHHLHDAFAGFTLREAPYDGLSVRLDNAALERHHRAFAVFVESDLDDLDLQPTQQAVPLVAKTPFATREFTTGLPPEHPYARKARQLFDREQAALQLIWERLAARCPSDVSWLVRPAERPLSRDRFVVVERYGPSLHALGQLVGSRSVELSDPRVHRVLATAMVCGVRSIQSLGALGVSHRDIHPDNLRFELRSSVGADDLLAARYACLIDLDHADTPQIVTAERSPGVEALLGHPSFQAPSIWRVYGDEIGTLDPTVTFTVASDLFGLAASLFSVCTGLAPWQTPHDGTWQSLTPYVQDRLPLRLRELAEEHRQPEHHCRFDRAETCAFGTGVNEGTVRLHAEWPSSVHAALSSTEHGRSVLTWVSEVLGASVRDNPAPGPVAWSIIDELEANLELSVDLRPPMGSFAITGSDDPHGATVEPAPSKRVNPFTARPRSEQPISSPAIAPVLPRVATSPLVDDAADRLKRRAQRAARRRTYGLVAAATCFGSLVAADLAGMAAPDLRPLHLSSGDLDGSSALSGVLAAGAWWFALGVVPFAPLLALQSRRARARARVTALNTTVAVLATTTLAGIALATTIVRLVKDPQLWPFVLIGLLSAAAMLVPWAATRSRNVRRSLAVPRGIWASAPAWFALSWGAAEQWLPSSGLLGDVGVAEKTIALVAAVGAWALTFPRRPRRT